MSKTIIIIIVAAIVVGGGAFYGGMKYQESTRQTFALRNLGGQEQRQQFLQEGAGRGIGAGFLSGEVIDKDERSLTLKMPDGSTKIIFFSGSTEVSKMTDGSINDIEIGKQTMITGDQNSDGSLTAKTIQLSPRSLVPRNSE